jgi:hypothetical protein
VKNDTVGTRVTARLSGVWRQRYGAVRWQLVGRLVASQPIDSIDISAIANNVNDESEPPRLSIKINERDGFESSQRR